MTQSLDEISKGNFDTQLKREWEIDEINKLSDYFNRIVASMKLAVLRSGVTKEEIGIIEKEKLAKKEEAQRSLPPKQQSEKPTNEKISGKPVGVKAILKNKKPISAQDKKLNELKHVTKPKSTKSVKKQKTNN